MHTQYIELNVPFFKTNNWRPLFANTSCLNLNKFLNSALQIEIESKMSFIVSSFLAACLHCLTIGGLVMLAGGR